MDERGRDPWTAIHELLAQLIEVTSIPAAEMRLNEPLKVPRPGRDASPAPDEDDVMRPAAESGASNPYRAAIAGLTAVQPQRRLHLAPNPDDEQEQTG